MPISRRDVLQPHGQRFAIGDLVILDAKLMSSTFRHYPIGAQFRIMGTHQQICRGFNNTDPYADDYKVPDKKSYDWYKAYNRFSIIGVESSYTYSWIDGEYLTLVSED